MSKPVLLSGIQPSGSFTLGNYLGALCHFKNFQSSYKTLYCIVDLHALTTRQDPVALQSATLDVLAYYLACGLNPQQSILFAQSQVPEHTQLAWLLQCFTYFGELQRMTQFKDKSTQHINNINAGLFGYPVLMAADILLYHTDYVPVGDDQTQHLELTRHLAQRINGLYGPIFKVPQRLTQATGARVMSLADPTKKMSKSSPQSTGVIYLSDSESTIHQKFKNAITDSDSPPIISYDRLKKPGISNLLDIYAALTHRSHEECEIECRSMGYAAFKYLVAEATYATLHPIQQRFDDIRQDESQLKNLLRLGAQSAKESAQKTLDTFYRCLGLL